MSRDHMALTQCMRAHNNRVFDGMAGRPPASEYLAIEHRAHVDAMQRYLDERTPANKAAMDAAAEAFRKKRSGYWRGEWRRG